MNVVFSVYTKELQWKRLKSFQLFPLNNSKKILHIKKKRKNISHQKRMNETHADPCWPLRSLPAVSTHFLSSIRFLHQYLAKHEFFALGQQRRYTWYKKLSIKPV